eukprot:4660120-Pyramimonas_sp.AAC.2
MAAERFYLRCRGRPWSTLALICEVHIVHNIQKRSMLLAEEVVKGVIHIALGFCTAGVMSDFRACLRHVIREKLRILRGRPSAETLAYRRAAIRSFVPGGGNESVRRALLHILPNGDWTNVDHVEVWIDGEGDIDAECVGQR